MWITGLPASGKSTLARALKARLTECGVNVAVLESDELRKVLSPHPRYDEQERDIFYGQIAYIGTLLIDHGVSVLFDATANLRRYRDRARKQIPRLLEVYVDTQLSTCMARDPKGIYKSASANLAATVPGLNVAYESPEHPDVVVHGADEDPDAAAQRVIAKLIELGFL